MLLTLIALTSLSLPAAQDATQNDWGRLSELLGSPDTTTPSNAEDAIERQRRISELVQVMGESERAMNGEQRVLYVEACETLGRCALFETGRAVGQAAEGGLQGRLQACQLGRMQTPLHPLESIEGIQQSGTQPAEFSKEAFFGVTTHVVTHAAGA